jgi:hypothetical protein
MSTVNDHLGPQEESRPKEVVIRQVQFASLFLVYDDM